MSAEMKETLEVIRKILPMHWDPNLNVYSAIYRAAVTVTPREVSQQTPQALIALVRSRLSTMREKTNDLIDKEDAKLNALSTLLDSIERPDGEEDAK